MAKAAADRTPQTRERRVASQTPAAIWREGMSQPLSCIIRDKSASGAMLEFPANRFIEGITEFVVGDQLTLSMTAARERTSVSCIVVRIDGRRCGVKFNGQFRTQVVEKPRKLARTDPAEKGTSAKLAKSLFSSSRG